MEEQYLLTENYAFLYSEASVKNIAMMVRELAFMNLLSPIKKLIIILILRRRLRYLRQR